MLPGMKKGLTIAINQAAIRNHPDTFPKLFSIAPKVCITTANEPEFLGFHAFIQTGAHSMGGRFGAAQPICAESVEAIQQSPTNIQLNPLNLWQYTVWETPEAHERMDYENNDRIFEFCAGCLTEVVDGPWEPVYKVAEVDMPPLVGMSDVPAVMGQAMANQEPIPKVRLAFKRFTVLAEHRVREGHEEAFMEGLVETLNMMKASAPGMLGWMILEKIGESALSTLQLTPQYYWEAMETLGANPPSGRVTNYGEFGRDYTLPPIPTSGPREYIVHTEWESPETLQFGIALPAVNPKMRKVHDEGVMQHLAQVPPYYRVFAPVMEDMVFFH